MRVVRALALLHVAASLLAGVRCSAERAAPATSVVVVCDLNPLGKPAFPELEATWLSLAAHLARRGHNVTMLPIADPSVDYGQEYLVRTLNPKVEAARTILGESVGHFVKLVDAPVFHNFATTSWAIHGSYSLYAWLKGRCPAVAGEGKCGVDEVYFVDWGGAPYYSLLAQEQGLRFRGVRFVRARTVGTRLEHASLRGVVATTDLLGTVEDIQAAHMEEHCARGASAHLNPEDFVSRDPTLPRPAAAQSPNSTTEFVFVGTITQADGAEVFASAVDRLGRHLTASSGPPIRATLVGATTYFPPDAKATGRKAASRSKVEAHFEAWVDRAASEHGAWVQVSSLRLKPDQALGYLTQNPNAVAVLCNAQGRQGFARRVLEANGVRVMYPVGRGEENGAPCAFKPTAGGLFRAMRDLSSLTRGEGLGDQCRLNLVNSSSAPATSDREAGVGTLQQGSDERDDGDWRRHLVTVVVTHYNRGSFLLQALASLRDQTHREIEVVVVDDGSDDPDSLRVLDSLEGEAGAGHGDGGGGGPNVRVVRVENGYLGAARNVGMKEAAGDFVLFMDDDNYAKPDEVETFLRALHHTGADVAACASEYLPSSLDPKEAFNASLHRQERSGPKTHVPLGPSVASGLFSNTFGDANMMVRRSAAEASGFSWPEDDAYSVQDWEVLAMSAASAELEVILVPEPLFYYRTTSTSMAQTASTSEMSTISDQLFMRGLMRELPLGLGPLIPYVVGLRSQLEESRKEAKELRRRSRNLASALRPLVEGHCKHRRMFNADPFGKNLLLNPSFMEWNNLEDYKRTRELARMWKPYETGYTFTREGLLESNVSSPACLAKLDNIGKVAGAAQEVVLRQREPNPLLLHGWSRALNVSGAGEPVDYSLYADITFMDWSHAWGEYAPFDQTKDGWQRAFGVLDFGKPIYSVVVVLMFRWRTGAAVFDDVSLSSLQDGVCGCDFDGMAAR